MAKSSTVKQRISITISPFTNNMLDLIGKKSGVNKSSLIETAVKKFLKDKLEDDTKKLSALIFDDLPTENEWTQIQSKLD